MDPDATPAARTHPATHPPVRWGVIGPGRIADGVVRDLALVDGGVLHAVASRDLDRARTFAAVHGAARAYGAYDQLLADPDVDVVYIATPHRQHHGIALAAIEAGKHLLVEKAFTCTLTGTREVVEAARAAGTFCMEAMWTRFQPAVVDLRARIAAGDVGQVRSVTADLGLAVPFDASDRLWDPAQGGGALLDLGVYPVAFAQMVLGDVQVAGVAGSLAQNGVDAESTVLLAGAGGAHATAACSLRSPLPGTAAVHGTEGWIEVPPRFHHPRRIRVHRLVPEDRSAVAVEERPALQLGAGYAHELEEVHRCVAAGRTESAIMPLDDTLAVMGVLEAALHALGVEVDEDPSPL